MSTKKIYFVLNILCYQQTLRASFVLVPREAHFPFPLSYCRRRYSHCQQLFQTWPNCVCLEKIVNLARTPPCFGSPASVSQMYLFPFCFLPLFFTFSLCSSFFYGSSFCCCCWSWFHVATFANYNSHQRHLFVRSPGRRRGVKFTLQMSGTKSEWQWRKSKDPNLCAGQGVQSRLYLSNQICFGKQNLRALCHLIHTAPLIPYLIKFCLQ